LSQSGQRLNEAVHLERVQVKKIRAS